MLGFLLFALILIFKVRHYLHFLPLPLLLHPFLPIIIQF
nr:MAG TPA: hypothetical protein [Crassvirales sp.]